MFGVLQLKQLFGFTIMNLNIKLLPKHELIFCEKHINYKAQSMIMVNSLDHKRIHIQQLVNNNRLSLSKHFDLNKNYS